MAIPLIRLLSFLNFLVLLPAASDAVSVATPCGFPAIFNFGDSNSDTGGLSAAFGPAPPPNGESFFNGPAGRYSDGRLIIDFIANSLELPYLSAYLNSVGSNYTHGANFATAGSTIREPNATLFQRGGFSPFSLDVQSWQYSQFKSRSQLAYNKGGVFKELMPKQEYFSKALYTFDIGQNDLVSGYFRGKSPQEVEADVPDIINKFTAVIKKIYAEGGRYFWIHNTGPAGCLPYVMDEFYITAGQVDRFGCASPFNQVAQFFNRKLKKAVVQLRKDLPLASLTYVDIYSVKHSLITRAKHHGFEHPLIACCGHGGKYNYNPKVGCGGKVKIHGKEVLVGKSCKNPSVRIIWDGVHFTQAANQWVFEQIVDGQHSDPPLPIQMACHKKLH